MSKINNLTLQDLNPLKTSLCNANISVTWYGKQIVTVNNESFPLHELTEKVLEISTSENVIKLTDLERLPALEMLGKIKDLSHQAKKQLKSKDFFTLFTRAVLWMQDHTLGVISPQWRKDYIKTTRQEAKKNFLPLVVDKFEKTVKANIHQVRKTAYKQLLVKSAEEQKKSPEVIEKIMEWCDGIGTFEIYDDLGLVLFVNIVQDNHNKNSNKAEAHTFIISQIPDCIEQICSKNVVLKLAKEKWFSCPDKKNFQEKLQKALQTDDSLLNGVLKRAKECGQSQDFQGMQQALREVIQILHQIQIEDWSFAAEDIPHAYVPKKTITDLMVEDVCLAIDKSTSPSRHKVEITLEDGRKATREIGPFEFRALLNIFPDHFTLDGPKSEYCEPILVRFQNPIVKDFFLSEAKLKKNRSTQKTCDITKFLSFAFDTAITKE
jgi:hypothetical protein